MWRSVGDNNLVWGSVGDDELALEVELLQLEHQDRGEEVVQQERGLPALPDN